MMRHRGVDGCRLGITEPRTNGEDRPPIGVAVFGRQRYLPSRGATIIVCGEPSVLLVVHPRERVDRSDDLRLERCLLAEFALKSVDGVLSTVESAAREFPPAIGGPLDDQHVVIRCDDDTTLGDRGAQRRVGHWVARSSGVFQRISGDTRSGVTRDTFRDTPSVVPSISTRPMSTALRPTVLMLSRWHVSWIRSPQRRLDPLGRESARRLKDRDILNGQPPLCRPRHTRDKIRRIDRLVDFDHSRSGAEVEEDHVACIPVLAAEGNDIVGVGCVHRLVLDVDEIALNPECRMVIVECEQVIVVRPDLLTRIVPYERIAVSPLSQLLATVQHRDSWEGEQRAGSGLRRVVTALDYISRLVVVL